MSVGAIVMRVSTIVVATNAQLLRRLQLSRDPPTVERAPD
jgi:cation transport ATPase